ncbi:MAG TPA: type II toxin-antitoxin system prevent-host-death family antitoxin [Acidobacteriota bacterium]
MHLQTRVGIKQARQMLSALLHRVEAGEEIVLVRRGKEVARLVPPRAKKRRLPRLEAFRATLRVRGEALSAEVLRQRELARF